MQYFKHYHNADSSEFNQKVIKEFGLIGYAHWNLLLELMCGKFKGDSILIRLTVPEVATKLRVKPARVHSIISRLSELSENQVITKLESNHNQDNLDGFVIIISAPILVDLKEKDFARARTVRAVSALRDRVKNKNKEEEIEKEDTALFVSKDSLSKVTPDKIIDLFNLKFKDVGKMKQTPSFGLPRSVLDDFKIMLGFTDFQKIESWESYFDLVSKSKFLTTQFTPSIAWLFKSENAFKVLGGQYQDKDGAELGDEWEKTKAMMEEKYGEKAV